MKKKTIAIFVSSVFLMVAAFSLVSAATNGQPFNALQDSLDKMQAQVNKLSQDFSNSNTGGVHRVVKEGTIPSNIPRNLGADDKVGDTIVSELGTTFHRYYYFKVVAIPEIKTSQMPLVTLYLKYTDNRYGDLGNDTWEPIPGYTFVKDGAVYLQYASDNAGSPYAGGVDIYDEMGGRDYKLVVDY